MRVHNLLSQIWDGSIELRNNDELSPLARALSSLLTVPTVSLTTQSLTTEPEAIVEWTELMPGASLGDILYEELGFNVPRGAIILVEPRETTGSVHYQEENLSSTLGSILVSLAGSLADNLAADSDLSSGKSTAHGMAKSLSSIQIQ